MTATDGFRVRASDYPPGMVAVVAGPWMWTESVMALVQMFHAVPPGTQCNISVGSFVDRVRNHVVRQFLEAPKLAWLLFCDADQVPPQIGVLRLLSTGKDVVGGVYVGRAHPYRLNADLDGSAKRPVGLGFERLEDAPIEVRRIGTGFLLVRRRVLEALTDPWFRVNAEGVGEDYELLRRRARRWVLGLARSGALGWAPAAAVARPGERGRDRWGHNGPAAEHSMKTCPVVPVAVRPSVDSRSSGRPGPGRRDFTLSHLTKGPGAR